MIRRTKKPNVKLIKNSPVAPRAPIKRSIVSSDSTIRYQSAKRRRPDSSSAAKPDVPSGQGADTLTRADIPEIVETVKKEVLRNLPYSTLMPTDDAHDNLELPRLADNSVNTSLGKVI